MKDLTAAPSAHPLVKQHQHPPSLTAPASAWSNSTSIRLVKQHQNLPALQHQNLPAPQHQNLFNPHVQTKTCSNKCKGLNFTPGMTKYTMQHAPAVLSTLQNYFRTETPEQRFTNLHSFHSTSLQTTDCLQQSHSQFLTSEL